MAESNVAIRYAKPILELAEEKGVLDAVYEDMKLIKETCEEKTVS